VRVESLDVDRQPVNVTRSPVVVRWSRLADPSKKSPTVPFDWTKGSRYVVPIPPSARRLRGEYRLVVLLTAAVVSPAGDVGPCVLLNETLLVACSNGQDSDDCGVRLSVQHILLGAILGASAVAVSALLAWQIRAHKRTAARFFKSFVKHEGHLAFWISFTIWVRCVHPHPPKQHRRTRARAHTHARAHTRNRQPATRPHAPTITCTHTRSCADAHMRTHTHAHARTRARTAGGPPRLSIAPCRVTRGSARRGFAGHRRRRCGPPLLCSLTTGRKSESCVRHAAA
jgi:hypothetical protein